MAKPYEYNGKRYEFPDEVSDDQALSLMKDDQGEGDKGFVSGLMSKVGPTALVDSAVEFGQSVMPWNWKKTVQGIGEAQGRVGQGAIDAAKRGDYATAVRKGINWALPMIGPQIDAAADKFNEGKPGEGLGETIGVGLQLAGPKLLKDAVPMVRRAAPGPVRAVSNAIKKSAAGNYESVLAPNKSTMKVAEEIAPKLAEESPIALTQEQLIRKTRRKMRETGPKAGDAYVGKPPVDPSEVYQALDELRKQNSTVKGTSVVSNPSLDAEITKISDVLKALEDQNGMIPAEALDDLRDKLFRGTVNASGQMANLPPMAAKTIQRRAGGIIKGKLDDSFPDAQIANDQYHVWRQAFNLLDDARKTEKAAKYGVIKGSSQGFGALAQKMLPRPVRDIPARIAGIFDSVAWNTVSGATKMKIADAVAKGDWAAVETLLLPSQGGALIPDQQ